MKEIQNYTLTLSFVRKNHGHIKKHIDLKSQAIYDDKNNFKKILHVLEDGASGVQIGDIEETIV